MTATGKLLSRLLYLVPGMEDWRDPERVWQFQQKYGVNKVKVVENKPGLGFDPVDYDAFVQKQNQMKKDEDKGHGKYKDAISSSGYSSEDPASSGENVLFYRIGSIFWYYVYLIGTQLGDETYYSIFFTVWFWNIDGAVGRRLLLVWNLIMYIGQGMKDIIRWPRPQMPTVVQLEKKWALEYGMPSTHAMVGLAVPTAILYYTIGRYQYPFFLWAAIAFVWCYLVCTSRIYLGMHSFADIYVGLAFSAFLLVFILPFVDYADSFLLSHPLAPLCSSVVSIAAVLLYPGSDRWTPARGDTTIILGTYMGTQLGYWCNFQLGIVRGPPLPPPYPILWPEYPDQYGHMLLRLIVGGVTFMAIRAVVKPTSYFIACYLMGEDMKKLQKQPCNIENKHKIYAELTYKFVTYVFVGFNVVLIAPVVFQVIGIQRSTFNTEV